MKCKYLLIALGIGVFASNGYAHESATLRKIQETGIINVGYRDASIPFSYLDDKQRPIGYSLDLCYLIVDAVKLRLKLQSLEVRLTRVTSANRMAFILNAIVDLECGTTTNSVDRQQSVSFSVTTFLAEGRLVSKKSSNIQSLSQLKGKSVVSTAGTTSMELLAELNRSKELNMRILVGKDHAESFSMVETDRALAFAMDDVIVHGLVASSKNPDDYIISEVPLSIEPYGIVFRKNDSEFKKLADDAIVKAFKSGEINQLYQKWFLSPIPPKQINLQLPMSDMLKRVIAHPSDSGVPGVYR
ncbi:MAG: transporter substrate-binding domain-containing protein [Pseudomonadota bacterium]